MKVTTASYTRPANTTAYTAGDAVTTALTLEVGDYGAPQGTGVMITGASLRFDINAVPSGMAGFRAHLYSAAPDVLAENAAWDISDATDRGVYQGFIDFPVPADLGSTLFSQVDNLNRIVRLDNGTSLVAVIQTIGAYTPAASTVLALTLHSMKP